MNHVDLFVIDKSIQPCDGYIAVYFIDGDFTVKRIKKDNGKIMLLPENPTYKPIVIIGKLYLDGAENLSTDSG